MVSSTAVPEQPSDRQSVIVTDGAGSRVISPATLDWQIGRGNASLINHLEHEWQAICDSGSFRYQFLRPPLVRAYLDSFAPDADVLVITARREGTLVAVLPLIERTIGPVRLGLRWVRSAGNLHFPIIDVISNHEDPRQLSRELWNVLRASQDWDVLQIDITPRGGIADQVRDAAEKDGALVHTHDLHLEAPYLEIPDTSTLDDIVARQRSSLRQNLRRGLRRLRDLGEVRIVAAGGDGNHEYLAETYQQFVDLEHRSPKGAAGDSIKADHVVRGFYERLLDDPVTRNMLRVHILTCNGDPVAGSLGMASGTTMYGMRISYSDVYRACSPGHLLILYLLQSLGEEGFQRLDLGRGNTEYKRAWTTMTTPQGYIFIFNKGLRGRFAHTAMFVVGPKVKEALGKTRFQPILKRLLQ
jgi:CelD/BcsL family acetyltransferase involved in cellulose biosynthesis